MQTFSMELFAHPTAAYRAAPFWSWNGPLERERLARQIAVFREMGFGGFYMHSRYGLETAYLSEEFFDCVGTCIEAAKAAGMQACLYDEDRWPSGYAGGAVTCTPRYRQRTLILTADEEVLPPLTAERDAAVERGEAYLVGCYDVEFTDEGRLRSYRRIRPEEPAAHRKIYAYSETMAPSGRYNFQTYADIMQPEAMARFTELTHREYFRRFGAEYGKTVPTIFSDEPRHIPIRLPEETCSGAAAVCWTYRLPERFRETYGYDLIDRLPELFWDREGVHSALRYDYFQLTTRLTREAFFDTLGTTARQQGLRFCGHLMMEDELFQQLSWGGDLMQLYPAFDIPGIDMLFDRIELLTAKQTQSVVRQYGKPGMLSELYGVTGWDFDFKCLKMQGDWQAVCGVTLRVPHLAMYSMKGSAKRDYPASFNEQAPWCREFRTLEDHYARLNVVFEGGRDVVDVAVIHPIESTMLSVGPRDTSAAAIRQQEREIHAVIRTLLYAGYDFDFLCEGNLPAQETACSDRLQVGAMSYAVVVVPPVLTLRETTVALLERFLRTGGRVIFLGECPRYLDGRPSRRVEALYRQATVLPTLAALPETLEPYRRVRITQAGTPDGPSDKLYRLSEKDGDRWLLIATAREMGKTDPARRTVTPERVTIEIAGEYGVTVYNTLTGTTEPADYTVGQGKTLVRRDWYANDSLLLRLTQERPAPLCPQAPPQPYRVIVPEQAVCTRTEPNCVVLDRCRVSPDGIAYGEEDYVLAQNEAVCRALNLTPTEAQPYIVEDPPGYPVYARYTFRCTQPLSGLQLALERAGEARLWLNGAAVPTALTGWYVDEDIPTVALPATRIGENELTVQLPITIVRQLEPGYLLGEFAATLEGTTVTLSPAADAVGFTAPGRQGMPFYGGTVIYRTALDTEDCVAEIAVADFAAPCIRVLVDGRDAGLIAWAPFTVRTPLTRGRHTLELVCYGNRNNTFGPIHNRRIADPHYYIVPSSWDADADYTEGYCFQETGILSAPVIRLFKEEAL